MHLAQGCKTVLYSWGGQLWSHIKTASQTVPIMQAFQRNLNRFWELVIMRTKIITIIIRLVYSLKLTDTAPTVPITTGTTMFINIIIIESEE